MKSFLAVFFAALLLLACVSCAPDADKDTAGSDTTDSKTLQVTEESSEPAETTGEETDSSSTDTDTTEADSSAETETSGEPDTTETDKGIELPIVPLTK